MRRLSLLAAALIVGAAPAAAILVGTHFDRSLFLKDCTPCHAGHGAAGTALLTRTELDENCLVCHDAGIHVPSLRTSLGLTQSADPPDIRSELSKPAPHRGASCMDCHSIHGVHELTRPPDDSLAQGFTKPSTRRGFDREADLCLSCHGTRGPRGEDPLDLAYRFDATNRSYHPVLQPGVADSVPSLREPLTPVSMINCTDCHTNDDPAGPRGPHASLISGLLGAAYATEDGQPESEAAYALCYSCHQRQVVLEGDAFPLHTLHVVELRTPCIRCHDSHGVPDGRALIRFNDEQAFTWVSPSASRRLEFVSGMAGVGACYLSCHGVNHDPLGYGVGYAGDGRPLFESPAPRGPVAMPNDRSRISSSR